MPRRILEGPEPYDRALWQAMAEMGWTGAAIPEEFGGAGLGHLAVCVLAEELGHAVAPVPFASSVYLATEAIQLFGSDAQKRQLPAEAGRRRIDRHPRDGRATRAGRCRAGWPRMSPTGS